MKEACRLRAGFRHLLQAACILQHPAYRRMHAASSLHAGFITIVCNLQTIVSRLHTLVCRLHTVVLSKKQGGYGRIFSVDALHKFYYANIELFNKYFRPNKNILLPFRSVPKTHHP